MSRDIEDIEELLSEVRRDVQSLDFEIAKEKLMSLRGEVSLRQYIPGFLKELEHRKVAVEIIGKKIEELFEINSEKIRILESEPTSPPLSAMQSLFSRPKVKARDIEYRAARLSIDFIDDSIRKLLALKESVKKEMQESISLEGIKASSMEDLGETINRLYRRFSELDESFVVPVLSDSVIKLGLGKDFIRESRKINAEYNKYKLDLALDRVEDRLSKGDKEYIRKAHEEIYRPEFAEYRKYDAEQQELARRKDRVKEGKETADMSLADSESRAFEQSHPVTPKARRESVSVVPSVDTISSSAGLSEVSSSEISPLAGAGSGRSSVEAEVTPPPRLMKPPVSGDKLESLDLASIAEIKRTSAMIVMAIGKKQAKLNPEQVEQLENENELCNKIIRKYNTLSSVLDKNEVIKEINSLIKEANKLAEERRPELNDLIQPPKGELTEKARGQDTSSKLKGGVKRFLGIGKKDFESEVVEVTKAFRTAFRRENNFYESSAKGDDTKTGRSDRAGKGPSSGGFGRG
jgi:hypothetical protein